MKRFLFLMLSWMLFLPAVVQSQEPIKVLVLPFDVMAQKDLTYLQTEIPVIFQKELNNLGLETIGPEALSITGPIASSSDLETVQNLAKEANSTHVVWGILNWKDEQFEIISYLLAAGDNNVPEELTASGKSIENLLGVVQQLASDIGKKLVRTEVVADMSVKGNVRIEKDAILRVVSTKPGDEYSPQKLSADLKAVYAMGYFDDIRINSEDSPEGKVIVFEVREKPTIKSIDFKGNLAIKTEKLQEDLDISVGSIMNIFSVRQNIERIKLQYQEKQYLNAGVTYDAKPLDNNQVALTFKIEEGERIRIKSVTFVGNEAFKTKKLKKIVKTSEKGFFSWLTSSGEFKQEVLARDLALLDAFYQNNGYMDVRIAEPDIEKKDNWLNITFKLEEGPQYSVGNVDVTGDLVVPKEELLEHLGIIKETIFKRDLLREDILALNDVCADYGYAFADTTPLVNAKEKEHIVDITYDIKKGNLVYFEKILISGNTHTRDKVIRRELKVEEQGQFSGKLLKKSVKNLNRLDFFEDVKANTYKGSTPDTMVLDLNVTEKPTGSVSFGGGYSSVESVFITASVSQNNLFGRGQALIVQAQVGGRTTQFNTKFVEPWLFDMPLTGSVNLYNWERDYDNYDKNSMGGNFSLSYPFFEDIRLFASYGYDVGEISDIDEDRVANDILDLEGSFITSFVTTGISYDTRDLIVNPTSGQDHRLTVEYAGLGGDIGYTKVTAEAGVYIPLFWHLVGFVHGEVGYITQNSGMKLPDYERFYLGGINSIRGYGWRDIHLIDEKGAEIGGNKKVQFNIELIFPLLKDAGLMGVVFFDTGGIFGESNIITERDADGNVVATRPDSEADNYDFGNLRKTAGFGFRWYSPMGPIRVEYGHILDPQEGDSGSGRWEFTMGAAF